MTATLSEIIEHKRLEIAAIMGDRSLAEVRAEAEAAARPASIRDFFSALAGAGARSGPERVGPPTRRGAAGHPVAIIAEIKRRSPSAGQIRPEYAGESFAPERIARLYTEHGASAISCLTDEKFFGGHPGFIRRVKAATPLPVLRKDFLIDPRQIWESRALGADAILLIAECLPGDSLAAMADEAAAAGLTALIEIHDEANLERAAALLGGPTLRGGSAGGPTLRGGSAGGPTLRGGSAGGPTLRGGSGTPTVPGGRASTGASTTTDSENSSRSDGARPAHEIVQRPDHPARPPRSEGLPRRLLGINNRNLATMTTDLAHTLRLAASLPPETRRLLVSESGIRRREDLDALAAAGVAAALVGESLMREADPGAALTRLLVG